MKKPNILFIIMDDQRADTLRGFPGNRPHTPNQDKLVDTGTSFRNTFITTPICTPARAEVLTGCHTFHNEVPWFGMPINPDLTLMPGHFQEHGYHTIHSGKWHNDGHPKSKGNVRTRCVMNQDNLLDHREYGHTMRYREEDGTEVQGHSTELFTNAAIEEIQQAPEGSPWFCYLAFHSPHDPFDCPPPFDQFHQPESVPLPENYMPEAPADNGDLTIRDELLLPWPRTQGAVKRYLARYWNMITHHDYHIGRILDELERTGQRENTIIVITSDHGLAVGSHGLLGKENMYDHSTRIPWVMTGPGIEAGNKVDALVQNVDIFPTLCDCCKIPVPDTVMDGVSHFGFLRGSSGSGRDYVISSFTSPDPQEGSLRETQRAIRTDEWKLVCFPLIDRYELYNLGEDPFELKNLLASWRINPDPRWDYSPERTADSVVQTARQLKQTLMQWQKANKDPGLSAIEGMSSLDGVVFPEN